MILFSLMACGLLLSNFLFARVLEKARAVPGAIDAIEEEEEDRGNIPSDVDGNIWFRRALKRLRPLYVTFEDVELQAAANLHAFVAVWTIRIIMGGLAFLLLVQLFLSLPGVREVWQD